MANEESRTAGPATADRGNPNTRTLAATVFDLDGVLTETTELHYQSWCWLADQLGMSHDRRTNDAMRGLGRAESLAVFLGARAASYSPAEKTELAERKNAHYLQLVADMTPADLFPGVRDLITGLRERGVLTAVASSSRNADPVIERLGLRELFNVIVDANSAPRSKPDPQVFLLAAERLGVSPQRCVVIEDAEAGVAAALAAGMRVIGVGPTARLAGAHLIVRAIAELNPARVVGLLPV